MTRRQPSYSPRFMAFACLALICGCNAGQIGGEVTEPSDPDGTEGTTSGSCEEGEITPVVAGEQTALGFDPERAIDLVEAEHEAALVWGVSNGAATVELTPAAGESRITVTVTPDPSSLRLVELHQKASSSGAESLLGESSQGCEDELRFDATVEVKTDNGALDDVFETTFAARSANRATAAIPVTPGENAGSFDVVVLSPEGAEAQQTALSLSFTPGGFSGTLAGIISNTDGEVASAAAVTYGRFPAETCEIGALVGLQSDLAVRAAAVLDGLRHFDLVWESGQATELSLTHSIEKACLDLGLLGTGETVIVQTQTSASTADGRIHGTWALEAQVSLGVDGSATDVALLRQAYLADTYSADEFETETGISGVALPAGSNGTFSFNVTRVLEPEAAAIGTFMTHQVVPADCSSQEPVELPEGGATAPGCAGSTVIDLESASLTGTD